MKIGRSINNCRDSVSKITGEAWLIQAKHVLMQPNAMQSTRKHRMHICSDHIVTKFHTLERDNLPAGKECEGCLYGRGHDGWVTQPELHVVLRHSAFLVVPGHEAMADWRGMTAAKGRREVSAEAADLGPRGSFQPPIVRSSAVLFSRQELGNEN